MFPTRRSITSLAQHLRLAVCLVHGIPAAAGLLRTHDGDAHVVAHHRNDALLTPCQLRAGLLEPFVAGVPHLVDAIASLELVGGAIDLGAGLFQRSHPAAGDERWFATTLRPERVSELAEQCPAEIEHPAIDVRVSADDELGVCAVCLRAPADTGIRLDAVASWLHGQCLVTELIEHDDLSR